MSEKKKWDLTSLHSLAGAAEWIRTRSGAAIVLVIRKDDAACAHAPDVEPYGAVEIIRDELPRLLQYLIGERARKAQKRGSSR